MGNIEAFNAARFFRKIQGALQGFADGFRTGFQYAEALFERVLGIALDQVQERSFIAPLRREYFNFVTSALRKRFFEQFAVFKIDGHMNGFRQIFRFQIELFEKRWNKFLRVEFFEILPIKFTAIDDASPAQVK